MKLISRNSVLDLSHPHIMGILNITPDSFYDGGKYNAFDKAIKHANLMINSGATIIDVGGESTRPGSREVSVEEELFRVIPIVEAIAQRFEVWISVDTSKPEIMRESAQAGAYIINDVCAFSKPGALEAVAETGLSACIMHMQGEPKTMQDNPKYNNVFNEINCFFTKHIVRCKDMGITNKQLILDPGFGFGKTLIHNYKLLANLDGFRHFGLPLLVGMSRKSMIRELLNIPISECLSGSIACAVIARIHGAHIIRTHDVKETAEAIRIVETMMSMKKKQIL